jgi:hypothetical protein
VVSRQHYSRSKNQKKKSGWQMLQPIPMANAIKPVVSKQMLYLKQSDGATAVQASAEDGHPAAKAQKSY